MRALRYFYGPASHFTMGGLWVDYHLMTTVNRLYAVGECNFADHGANRLGANSLMQACVDGYFILPYTLGHDVAEDVHAPTVDTEHPSFAAAEQDVRGRIDALMSIGGTTTPARFHRRLGAILWDRCGISRNANGLESALSDVIALREEFERDVRVVGRPDRLNPQLERALRVGDFMHLAELMVRDALARRESCGAHFREEHQTDDGEALRDDDNFMHVTAWEHRHGGAATAHREPLAFSLETPKTRSYK